MSVATETYSLLRAFIDELARCGLRAACTSPGSRSAPLVLSLVREQRIACYSHVDERCAGFFALGLAKSSYRPVAVTCTSGTAAAELLPAAIEAREARVPLLLLTADRPAELRENGAGQAIDQLKLFGGAAKWFFEVELGDASDKRLRWIRTLACRAYWTALEARPGVVHLNFPLREPLVTDDPLPADDTGRADGAPYVSRGEGRSAGAPATAPLSASAPTRTTAALGARAPAELAELLGSARRGVVIAGRHERPTPFAQTVASFCERAGWPLLADPLSGARRGAAAIAHYDALLRDKRFASTQKPDVVLRLGDLPVSKPLRTWLAGLHDVRQIALDPECAWQDPASVLSDCLALEPTEALSALARAADGPAVEMLPASEQDWLASWRSADELSAEAILGVLATDAVNEPGLAAELGVLLPRETTLFVASSMPVREIETFWPVRKDPPRVLCNRGANGIDGTVSSAFGAASCSASPTVLLIGDVALAHDIGGLLAASRLGLSLTIVLVDNGGGGIFDFLPVSRTSTAHVGDAYSHHIATPTGLDFSRVAALYDLAYQPAGTVAELREALEGALTPRVGTTIVHVRTERAANVELHSRVWRAVSQALNPPAAGAEPAA